MKIKQKKLTKQELEYILDLIEIDLKNTNDEYIHAIEYNYSDKMRAHREQIKVKEQLKEKVFSQWKKL